MIGLDSEQPAFGILSQENYRTLKLAHNQVPGCT
jgi:hypothetical protein